jgi:hypothetical protein
MSSYNIVKNDASKMHKLGSHNNGQEMLLVGPSLCYYYDKLYSANPVSNVKPGDPFTAEMKITEEFVIDEIYLNITATATTETTTVFNPFIMLNEAACYINNQEVRALKNLEEIFSVVSFHYRHLTQNELTTKMLELFPNNMTNPLTNGEAIAPGTPVDFKIPLTVLFPFLKGLCRSKGLSVLNFNFRFTPNYNTAASNGRFVVSSSANNSWTAATMNFTNINLQPIFTKLSNPVLAQVDSPVFHVSKVEIKSQTTTWTAGSSQVRYNLNTDFSRRQRFHTMLIYLFPTSTVTTFNDVDAGNINGSYEDICFVLKYRGNDVLKLDTSKQDMIKYTIMSHMKREGTKDFNNTIITAPKAGLTAHFTPTVFIDFQNIADKYPDSTVHGGFDSTSDFELIVSCPTWSSMSAVTVNLHACMLYDDFGRLDAQNGIFSWMKFN